MTKVKVVLTGKHGRPSTKEAFKSCDTGNLVQRRQFTKRNGKFVKYYRVFSQESKENYKKVKDDTLDFSDYVVLRWGSQEPIDTNASSIVYNKIPGLRNATDKGLARVIMNESEVRVPKSINPNNIKKKHLPIICRPFVHSKGKNFIILNSIQEFNAHYNPEKYYYARFIDKELEFRTHVGHGKVLRLMKKQNPNNGNIAWNIAANRGGNVEDDVAGFEVVRWNDSEPYLDVLKQSVHAVEALGLDCGGVDVMFKDDKAYVLEVNTAPTLNSCPTTAKRWGRYWNWLFNSDKRRPHYNWREWTKAKSFFFKNEQLDG